MTILSVAILILQLVILAIGVLIGYRRGLGRSTVRLCYLALIAVVSFFVGRSIAFAISGEVVPILLQAFPADSLVLIQHSPEIESLIAGMLGGLLAPFIFALLFGLLQLLSLICFKTISTKLVNLISKDKEAPSWSKWAGAGVGLVSGYLIAISLLMPLSSTLYAISDISDDAIAVFVEGEEIDWDVILAEGTTLDGALTPSLPRLSSDTNAKLPTPAFIFKAITSYNVLNENQEDVGNKDNIVNTLPRLVEVGADSVFAYQKTISYGGTVTDAVSNAFSRVVDHLEDSPSLKQAAISSLRAVGTVLEEGGTFLGVHMPKSKNEVVQHLIESTVHTFATANEDTVEEDLLLLFGMSADAVIHTKADSVSETESVNVTNNGLYTLLHNMEGEISPMDILHNPLLADAFEYTLGHMSNLDDLQDVVMTIRDYAVEELHDEATVSFTDESFKPFYENTCSLLEETINNCRRDGLRSNSEVAAVLEDAIADAIKENDFPVPEEYIPTLAICATTEFNTEKYSDGIKVTDLLPFFGVNEIPEWVD